MAYCGSLSELDLRSWFADGELEACPRCNQASALPTPVGPYLLCLECGLLNADGKQIADLHEFASALIREAEG